MDSQKQLVVISSYYCQLFPSASLCLWHLKHSSCHCCMDWGHLGMPYIEPHHSWGWPCHQQAHPGELTHHQQAQPGELTHQYSYATTVDPPKFTDRVGEDTATAHHLLSISSGGPQQGVVLQLLVTSCQDSFGKSSHFKFSPANF